MTTSVALRNLAEVFEVAIERRSAILGRQGGDEFVILLPGIDLKDAVTIAADAMKFHMPVVVGDEVSVYAELIAVGRTSMTIEVEAWRRARHSNDSCKVTQARFIFVADGDDRKPRPVPPETN